ncbi:methyltransferase [Natronomonas sp. EA1]|uniref:methyltransferase n=1 Tax=Natronomonas sp. EA1 TaxID=3421655 RepID=UPI003EB92AC7
MHRERRLLWAARDSGALDALLSTAGTPASVATETGLDERDAALLVDALAEQGFLERVGEEYEPTNRLLGFLTKTDLRSIGTLPQALDDFTRWAALPDTLRGEPVPEPTHALRNRLGAMEDAPEAHVRAVVTEALRATPDAERITVLADGPGRHAREAAERGLAVTLVETPEIIGEIRPLLAPTPVEPVAGDPSGTVPDADLVIAVDVARRYDEPALTRLLARAAGALGSEGAVVLVEPLRGETPGVALDAVEARARGESGRTHTRAAFERVFEAAGLRLDVRDVPGTDRFALRGRGVE